MWGRSVVELFELARVALPADAPIPDQPQRVAGVMTGTDTGFAELKGVVETLYAALHLELDVARSSATVPPPRKGGRDGGGLPG